MDRRLFLPEEWAADRPRRKEAGVPEGKSVTVSPKGARGRRLRLRGDDRMVLRSSRTSKRPKASAGWTNTTLCDSP